MNNNNNNIDLAITHEKQGIAMYEEFYEKFKNPIFSQILTIKKTGLEILKPLQKEEILPERSKKYQNIKNEKNAIFTAISYEIQSENLYDEMTNNIEDEYIKDILFRLWATSSNEYKVALENELNFMKKTDNEENDKKQANPNNIDFTFDSKSFEDLGKIFNKFSSGSATKEDIEKLLKNPNISFFAGAAIGALSGVLLNQVLEKKNDEK